MTTTYDQQIQVALDETEQSAERSDQITLSTGVVLQFVPFPILRLQAVADRFEYPEVPKIYNKDKDRWEENPFSEKYAEMKEEVDRKRGLAVVDTILAVGTQVVSVPDTFPNPADDEWIEELQISGITVNGDSKVARKLAWLKYVAIVTEQDLSLVTSYMGVKTGTSEVNVAKQLQNFQDN